MIALFKSTPRRVRRAASILLLMLWGAQAAAQVPPPAPTVTLSSSIKQIEFSWPTVPGALHYIVWESPDGITPFAALSGRIPQPISPLPPNTLEFTRSVAVHRHDWSNARYYVQACNAAGCSSSIEQGISTLEPDAIGYFKPLNSGAGDSFGYSVAVSADGHTLVVGAPYEDCSCTGVNPLPTNDLAPEAGAVYVFIWSGEYWKQQAYIKAPHAVPGQRFGTTIALSADGNTLIVGLSDYDVTYAYDDHVYAYTRSAGRWAHTAALSASNSSLGDHFGSALALSADGSTLAVAASGEGSSEQGVGGSGLNDDAGYSGAVYIFSRVLTRWFQTAYIKGSNSDAGDLFGTSVALSGDGNTLAVGSELDDGWIKGGHHASSMNCLLGQAPSGVACEAGAVDIYSRASGAWRHESYLRPAVFDADDRFGASVALSGDGSRLAVGAIGEDSAAVGDAGNNDAPDSGAAYIFERSGSLWRQRAYFKASDTDEGDLFGGAVALDEDGGTIAISARREDGSAAGASDVPNDLLDDAGAVFLFELDDTVKGGRWSQMRYVKAQNPGMDDRFGGNLSRGAIALSADGGTLVVPAADEDGSGAGVPGTPQDDTASGAGAVYLY